MFPGPPLSIPSTRTSGSGASELLPAGMVPLLLRRYGLARTRPRLVSRRSDSVLRLRLPQRGSSVERMLCVYPLRTQRRDIEAELTWLQALGPAAGVQVPRPLEAQDGSFVQRFEDGGPGEPRYAVLMQWPTGRCFDRGLTPPRLRQLGAALGRLHEASHRQARQGRFRTLRLAFPAADDHWSELAPTAANGLHSTEVQGIFEALRRVRGELLQLSHASESWGLIHANLRAVNVLFAGEQAGIVEFDECGWGHYGHDLATVLLDLRHPWCGTHDHRGQHEALEAGLLEGYQSTRPLPPHFERALPLLLRARMLAMVHRVLLRWPSPSTYPWGLPFVRKVVAHLRD